MNKDRLLTLKIIGEFQEKKLPVHIRREAQFPKISGKVHVAIGMRRVGKTYFLYQKISDLIAAGVPRSYILYLNMEDERLLPLDAQGLGGVVDAFYSEQPDRHDGKCWLFFDEIQNVTGWPLVIRRLLDTKNVEIYLSGSSAKLLSREIATELRGRALTTEIWPFSWREYLTAKKMDVPTKIPGPKMQDIYLTCFRGYLANGGFPEVVNYPPDIRLQTLQGYVQTVVYKDIVERHNITNLALLKRLVKTMLKNLSGRFSVNKCFKDFKSQGLLVAKNTIHDYLDHIRDAYLCFDSVLYTENLRRQNSNPRKIYAVDTGLALAETFSLNENWGALFENLIYTDLRRQGCQANYYITEDGSEIDFTVRNLDGKTRLYQACWDMSDALTRAREELALKAATTELKIKGKIITPLDYIFGCL